MGQKTDINFDGEEVTHELGDENLNPPALSTKLRQEHDGNSCNAGM